MLNPAYGDTADTLAFDSYSTTARDTGRKWHDGKAIWRKVILAAGAQAPGTKTYAHGIASIDNVVSLTGFLTRDDAGVSRTPINYPQTGALLWALADNTNITVIIDAAYTGAGSTLSDLEVVIEYTI